MKKWKTLFTMAVLTFLISVFMLSCQSNDTDDYSQGIVEVTAADLFIASEAYQNLDKEIRKDIRRRQNAISKFSKEEMEQYYLFMKQLRNPETRMEAKAQLNILLGYDEQIERNRILCMVREVYEGINVTRLELVRARQKRQMRQVVISKRAVNVETQLDECKKKCNDDMTKDVEFCYESFNECLKTVPASEKLQQHGPRYDACVDNLNFCLDGVNFDLITCENMCELIYDK